MRVLQSVGRTPERWKRRLRPALVRGMDTLEMVPGAGTIARLGHRIAPGLHAWIERRYRHYRDAGLGQAHSRAAASGEMASLGPRAHRIAGWLAGNGAPNGT